jgi:hypothetical protein
VDYGKILQPGFWGRLFGRRPRIVRDADIAAATESLPLGAQILRTDPNGNWLVYEMPNRVQQVRFRASEAWFPNEPRPMPNNTIVTSATIHADGRVVVTEGLHRTRAMARRRVLIDPNRGGVASAPGWLDFAYDPESMRDTPSTRAIVQMLGGDPEAPLIPAR